MSIKELNDNVRTTFAYDKKTYYFDDESFIIITTDHNKKWTIGMNHGIYPCSVQYVIVITNIEYTEKIKSFARNYKEDLMKGNLQKKGP